MPNDLLFKAVTLFEEQDKWDAFIELSSYVENIKNIWKDRLSNRLEEYFTKEGKMDGWNFNKDGMVWYLNDYGQDSFGIWWEHLYQLSFWANPSHYDIEKIKSLLESTKYSPLLNVFDGVVKKFNGNYLLSEFGNFSFGSIYDNNFGFEHLNTLAWYAGNETEEFANQIIKKVDSIRKEHFEIITELCEYTKIIK